MKRFTLLLALVALLSANVLAQFTAGTMSVTFTRPILNATAYTAGDVVKTSSSYVLPMTIPYANLPSAVGEFTGVWASADTAGIARFTLYILSDTTAWGAGTAADNAAFAPTYAMSKKIIAAIPIRLMSTGTLSAGVYQAFNPIPFNVTGTGRPLGFAVVCDSAYLPKAGGQYNFRFGVRFYPGQK